MRLAIADPPYPPMFGERRDAPHLDLRLTTRSRARRWYGDGPRSARDVKPGDFHPDAGDYDDLATHRALIEMLTEEYDGFVIATTPDGLGAYHPLPVSARVLCWYRPNAMPGGSRLMSRWEPVICFPPEERRHRSQGRISDTLPDLDTYWSALPQNDFVGTKPAGWTHWVLDAMGYDPETDTVHDLFPGSGSVSAAIATYQVRSA